MEQSSLSLTLANSWQDEQHLSLNIEEIKNSFKNEILSRHKKK